MYKTNSVDLMHDVKSLLKMMTNRSVKDNPEDEDYFISSEESDIESEDNENYSDSCNDEENLENRHDKIFRFTKFFADHVENTQKHLPSSTTRNNDFEFRNKMYRVIPLKLDDKIFKPEESTFLNQSRLRK